MTVYLLHFDRPYKHARHYLGYTRNVRKRVAEHASGHGARLTQVLHENGIGFKLARTWPKGTRQLERQLKNRKDAPKLCPICRAAHKR